MEVNEPRVLTLEYAGANARKVEQILAPVRQELHVIISTDEDGLRPQVSDAPQLDCA